MKIIKPSFKILTPISRGGIEELKQIELAARTCYKSESRIDENGDSAKKLVKMLIEKGHEAMLEHGMLSVKFICDRAVSHEIVRHRMASFAQESQRYCNYSKDGFGGEITFIEPYCITEECDIYPEWYSLVSHAEAAYFEMLEHGLAPQDARSILPNCTKTEIIVSANWREWRHILKLRTSNAAHPEMRRLMYPLLVKLYEAIPILFDDILAQDSQKKQVL